MSPFILAGGAVTVLAGGLAAAVQGTPTDYAGIAMIIAATASLVGTIGGIVIALRRKSTAREALELIHELRDVGGEADAS